MATTFLAIFAFVLPGLSLICCSSNQRTYDSGASGGVSIEVDKEWFADHVVLVFVLLVLGSIVILILTIVSCVCCIKKCTKNNRRTGMAIVNQAHPIQDAVSMTTTGQQVDNIPPTAHDNKGEADV